MVPTLSVGALSSSPAREARAAPSATTSRRGGDADDGEPTAVATTSGAGGAGRRVVVEGHPHQVRVEVGDGELGHRAVGGGAGRTASIVEAGHQVVVHASSSEVSEVWGSEGRASGPVGAGRAGRDPEAAGQGLAAAVQVDPDGRRAAVEDGGDVVDRPVLEVVEGHALGLALGQGPHRRPEHLVAETAGRHRIAGALLLAHPLGAGQAAGAGCGDPGPAVVVDGAVGDGPPHPRPGLVHPPDRVPAAVGGEEGLLGQLLGRRAVARERPPEGDHRSPVGPGRGPRRRRGRGRRPGAPSDPPRRVGRWSPLRG